MPTKQDPLMCLIRGIAIALVSDTQSVCVERLDDNGSTTLNLRVATADLGKILGKEGRTARSLRTILTSASMKSQRRCCLNIEGTGLTSSLLRGGEVIENNISSSGRALMIEAGLPGPGLDSIKHL